MNKTFKVLNWEDNRNVLTLSTAPQAYKCSKINWKKQELKQIVLDNTCKKEWIYQTSPLHTAVLRESKKTSTEN